MAVKPTTTKGGKVRVLLDLARNGTYAEPCGFLSKSVTLTKNLEDFKLPFCDDPTKVPWLGRDADSLAMGVSGDGVLASESVETWLDAVESDESIPAKVEWEFPAKTITWTGLMHVGTFTAGAPNLTGRVTSNVELSSDGEMVRTSA
ncbi:phage tail tube protein [Mesorhizobium sp. IMUNJ 23232]|uniref:phage tail tube protein n=1 Tax=Mesorhizobium sp. IMUNJ 23232 TaxID=3376064 RepID=UPI003790CE93